MFGTYAEVPLFGYDEAVPEPHPTPPMISSPPKEASFEIFATSSQDARPCYVCGVGCGERGTWPSGLKITMHLYCYRAYCLGR